MTEKHEKSRNNTIARRGRGAPKGNRNALRHGRHVAAYLARRRAYRMELRQLKVLAAGFKALGVELDLQAQIAMRIAMLKALARPPPPL